MISIITITYNNFVELLKTLYSIPNAEYVESVVINGGNCEKTKNYLENYTGKSITESDHGIADAFNKGVNNSSGKYIMFLNSGDVLLDQHYLEKSINILEDHPEFDFIHSNLMLIDEYNNNFFMRPRLKNLGRGMPYLHPTMIVRKTVFDKIGIFDNDLSIAMDFDWIVRLEMNNINGFYLQEDVVIKMDGRGKSVIEESKALKECFSIIRTHNCFNFQNSFGFATRYFFYLGRVFLVQVGLKRLLTFMKRVKHSK